jgi:PAS domain S-box-containing protein
MPPKEELRERLAFLRLHEEDRRALEGIRPLLEKHADRLVNEFYRHLLSFDVPRALLSDPDVKGRLLRKQREYLLSLGGRAVNEDYVEERVRIGETHERVHLQPRWYLGAYALYYSLLAPVVGESLRGSPVQAERVLSALVKILLLDAQLAMEAYIGKRERQLEFLNMELAEAQRQLEQEHEQQGRELRERERFLESLVDTANTVILLLSTDGRILEWNAEAERLFGVTREQAIGLHYPTEFLDPETRERVGDEMERLVQGGPPTRAYENPVLTRCGEVRTVLWNAVLVRALDGSPIGLLATGIDVTERRRAEELASIATLAAGLAHDVGSPMNVILGYARMLETGKVEEGTVRERARIMREQIQRVSGIIQSLLDLARPRDRQDALGRVALAERLDHALCFLHEKLESRRIAVERCFEPAPPVRGDAERLEQLFLNLLLNAADAMPGGGTLRLAVAPHGPGEVEVRVADTGTGISRDSLARIFDPFFTSKPRGQGSGLGLVVAKAIVTDHGGRIDVASEPGAGTEFRIVFPTSARG